MDCTAAQEKPRQKSLDPLDEEFIVRRMNQNPNGSWTFVSKICVKPGTDLVSLLRRSREEQVPVQE